MKGLILSGGTGTRLRPLTFTGAKQLIPVANKPILFYAIEKFKHAGITDIGIIIGETGEEVKKRIGDGSRWGVRVTYIEQEAPLGLAHAVKIAQPFMGDEPFVMFLGDNLIQEDLTGFVEKFRKNRTHSLILLSEVGEPQRFGVAEIKGGKIIRLVEKPEIPPSNLALVGVYLFDRNIFQAVSSIKPSWRNELEITDAIQWLVENGYNVEPHLLTGWWKDTGKPEDILEANMLVLDTIAPKVEGRISEDSRVIGRAVIGAGAKIVNSIIRGPVVIGRNSVISNSYIGPFSSVGDNVTISDSEIEYSIILEDSTIKDIPARIDQSLVGRNVTLANLPAKPKAFRFILGDNCTVNAL